MGEKVKRALKRTNKLDRYLIFSFAVVLVYIIAHTVIFAITGQEATTLTIAVFGLFGGEIISCLLIKKFKLHEEFKLLKGKEEDSDEPITDEGGIL